MWLFGARHMTKEHNGDYRSSLVPFNEYYHYQNRTGLTFMDNTLERVIYKNECMIDMH